MPLVSRNLLHGGATLYGLLLAGVGIGAVLGGFLLPRFKVRFDSNQIVAIATAVTAIMIAVFAIIDNTSIALATSILFRMGWVAALTSLSGSAQVALPDCFRARGLSVYLMIMFGSMTLGRVAWGQVASLYSIRVSLLVSAAGALLAIPPAWQARLGQGEALDLSPSLHWPAPIVSDQIKPDCGPVMMTIEYRIDPSDAHAFVVALTELSHARRRGGAFAWGIFEDAAAPGRYLEYFLELSWLEHLRHHERVTAADRPIEEEVKSFHCGETAPRVTHYLAPEGRI